MIAKDNEEIDILREGGKRLACHVDVLIGMVAPGVRVSDLDAHAQEMVREQGDTCAFLHYPSGKHNEKFPGGLCISINDCIVHGPAAVNEYVIQEGDVVSVDFGIKHRGLYTDHARTTIAGTGSPEDIRLVQGTDEALQAGIRAARFGNTIGDIGRAVQEVAQKYRFGYPKNLAGHGVGRSVHEKPLVPNFVTAGGTEKLVEGLVIAIEPMMSLGTGETFVDKDNFSYRVKDGSRTAHSEHTILITKHGPEILTRLP